MYKLTLSRLREVVTYCPETGYFFWTNPPHPKFKLGSKAGSHDSRGRPTLCIDQEIFKESRLVWFYTTGEWPKGEIDHIDGDHTNNRIVNLRDVSHVENMRNRSMTPLNTSGYSGVTWHSGRNKWRSRINVDGVRKHLGDFKSKEVAIAARKAAEIMYGYHPNHGRRKNIKKNPLITREELRSLAS